MALSSEVAALDAKRLLLQRDLDLLEKQRAHILARDAPIRRIVDDILAYIFELGAAEDVLLPEKVSAVSRHWRNVLLNTPAAWSNLVLDRRIIAHPSHAQLPVFIRRTEVFLQRSQSAPLTIILDLVPLPFDSEIHRLMSVLQGHLSRCAILHLHVDASWLSLIAGPLSSLGPALKDLEIRTSHSNITPISLSMTEVHGCIPHLHSLVLSNLPPSSLPLASYPALRHLQLHGVQWQFGTDGSHEWPWAGTANLLDASPNLQSLTLSRMEFILDGAELLTPRKILLKSLASLTFECMETRSIAIVLESLEAPGLKSLKMRYDPTKVGDHWCIHRLEAPCISSIEELEVDGYAVYGSNLPWFIRTLAMVPNLTKLSISNPPLFLDSRFFDMMSNGPHWLVPRLGELQLTACNNLHGQDLIRLLRARSVHATSGSVSPIRTLTIRLPPWHMLEEDILSVLRLNVEELHHLPLETYHTDRFVVPQSPMFRVATPPPPLGEPNGAAAWDIPPQLGTPFGVEEHMNPGFVPHFQPPIYPSVPGTTATSTMTSTSPRRSRSSTLWWTDSMLTSDTIQHMTTVLIIASATALTTSIACYHLFSRHVRTQAN
ncbi:hypothetical protein CPB86DRAFT_870671 [Serendipita vermifera]|nr:hypothetical protein CPB86DRAFT_870671 [Serendipita vermifera]